uniref:AW257883 n=1 Tax=Arundo donax TaxID=35708 RepID=A0A0A9GCT9_ARUDO
MASRPWAFLSALAYPKYGMTIVIDRADARRHASIMMKSSMRFSLTGEHVGWTKNTSQPLTLSCSCT